MWPSSGRNGCPILPLWSGKIWSGRIGQSGMFLLDWGRRRRRLVAAAIAIASARQEAAADVRPGSRGSDARKNCGRFSQVVVEGLPGARIACDTLRGRGCCPRRSCSPHQVEVGTWGSPEAAAAVSARREGIRISAQHAAPPIVNRPPPCNPPRVRG